MKTMNFVLRGFLFVGVTCTIILAAYLAGNEATAQISRNEVDPKAEVLPPTKSGCVQEKISELTRLSSLKPDNQEVLIEEISKDRRDSMGMLILLLGSANDNQTRCAAAYLLGWNRDEQAVSSLSEVITLEDDQYPRQQKKLWFWQHYPAAEALVKIGKPSVRTMILNLESSNDEKVRKLSLQIILAVEGSDITKFILERAVDKQEDTKKKANLKKALKELESASS